MDAAKIRIICSQTKYCKPSRRKADTVLLLAPTCTIILSFLISAYKVENMTSGLVGVFSPVFFPVFSLRLFTIVHEYLIFRILDKRIYRTEIVTCGITPRIQIIIFVTLAYFTPYDNKTRPFSYTDIFTTNYNDTNDSFDKRYLLQFSLIFARARQL